ncbi:MAG: hypothetical protein V4628_18400 [Pseudomonadota bacterium]
MITTTEEEIGTPLISDIDPAEDAPMLVIPGGYVAMIAGLCFGGLMLIGLIGDKL